MDRVEIASLEIEILDARDLVWLMKLVSGGVRGLWLKLGEVGRGV